MESRNSEFLDHIFARAVAKSRKCPSRVVFPEGEDARIQEAAILLKERRIADPLLLTQETVGDDAPLVAALEAGPRQLSPEKGQRFLKKPLYRAGAMVAAGEADVMVAGVAHPTRRVIEAGLMTVGLAEGIKTPSSYFLMCVPDFLGHGPKALLYADCAVNVNPTAEELADIALASAATAAALLPEVPRMAFLSLSSRGSATHTDVEKVTRALEIARTRAPDILMDGEFQADTALVPAVAARKLNTHSPVAGQANVLIFPDLDAGNIAYKLTQYMSGGQAIGPVLQGFAKPVADLSRGASVNDILATTATALATKADENPSETPSICPLSSPSGSIRT